MKRFDQFRRYSLQARKWAMIDALRAGWSVKDTVSDPNCIAWMVTRLAILDEAKHPTGRPAALEPGAAVPAPSIVPDSDYEAAPSFFDTLAGVGTLRSIHLVADGRGSYTATIKVTLPDGRRVYRYGRLHTPAGIETMLRATIDGDRWTPDKI